MNEIKITTPFIKLENLLKLSGCTVTGGEAKNAIQGGFVKLNGEICVERGKKIRPGDVVTFEGEEYSVKNENN